MPILMVRGDVTDFDTWRTVFDANAEKRRDHGCRSARRFRATDNPNHILVLFDWDTAENAIRFTSNPDLAKAQKAAGMTSRPDTAMFEEV